MMSLRCDYAVEPRTDEGWSWAHCYTHNMRWPYRYVGKHLCPIGIVEDNIRNGQYEPPDYSALRENQRHIRMIDGHTVWTDDEPQLWVVRPE